MLRAEAATAALPSRIGILDILEANDRLYCSLVIRIVWEDVPSLVNDRLEPVWGGRYAWLPRYGWEEQAFSYVHEACTTVGLPVGGRSANELNIGWPFWFLINSGYLGNRFIE